MHLLATSSSQVLDGSEPIDPKQKPAKLIFLSAADTDLAILSQAADQNLIDQNFLRLSQLSWLTHPYSVDLFLEQTALKSDLIIIRALGGLSYWEYCLEQFSVQLRQANKKFVALPGDDKPDPELLSLSNIKKQHWESLFGYVVEGGIANARNLLKYSQFLLGEATKPSLPIPVLKNGIYLPNFSNANLTTLQSNWDKKKPTALLVFYRSLYLNGDIDPIKSVVRALEEKEINPLPIYLTSLKDTISKAFLSNILQQVSPDIVLNFTNFSLSTQTGSSDWVPTILDKINKPVFQVCFASSDKKTWNENTWGLQARDIAMSVSLPELDGRIFTRSIAFKEQSPVNPNTQYSVTLHNPVKNRVSFVAELTENWVKLGKKDNAQKKLGFILANYPNKDGRIANGVGLDTPQSTLTIMNALKKQGYKIPDPPKNSKKLIDFLQAIPTNDLKTITMRKKGESLSGNRYANYWKMLPPKIQKEVNKRWGNYKKDPFFIKNEFLLPMTQLGNLAIGIQPARGFNIDPKETYHDPDLVPPHNYFAFYFWLRFIFQSDAIIHLGKHGNLEWLPGKALALSETCFPEVILGPTPHFYPFIINDPGEGTQAKRRNQAVIVDHLTPPMTRAESYGVYQKLEQLVDEYYEAIGVDAKRVKHLQKEITEVMDRENLLEDIGINRDEGTEQKLLQLDTYLCDIKERQIRDGLHVFGESPLGKQKRDLLISLTRIPREDGKGKNDSFLRSLAKDFQFHKDFDPLDCEPSEKWTDKKPTILQELSNQTWRSNGDTIERLELYFANLIDGEKQEGESTNRILLHINDTLQPKLESCGDLEIKGLLQGLNGEFVPPGPSGAPTRGKAEILPTGRNFYSVDSRSLPTRTAWKLGWKSATALLERYVQDKGDWPKRLGLTAWGTSNMRTGGDDIAQALALMGVKPTWDDYSGRVTGFEILPLSVLGRPRVDVTLRVSGFFRDAFPLQVDLLSAAARGVMELINEAASDNPSADSFNKDKETLGETRAGYRVFGSKPGAYGAGLQALIDEQLWSERSQLGQAYLEWGSYPLGAGCDGKKDLETFSIRLSKTQAVIQNQDNHEHDILDSDDYYQFEGGMSAAIESLAGEKPTIYHNDHSRPERPIIRTLEDEIGRVVRARAVNPKWINGIKRHGYKGAFEIAATVDYLFAFAATTGAAKSYHFDLTFAAYIEDNSTVQFIEENNLEALKEILNRYQEAMERNLWKPRSNSVRNKLFEMIERTNASR